MSHAGVAAPAPPPSTGFSRPSNARNDVEHVLERQHADAVGDDHPAERRTGRHEMRHVEPVSGRPRRDLCGHHSPEAEAGEHDGLARRNAGERHGRYRSAGHGRLAFRADDQVCGEIVRRDAGPGMPRLGARELHEPVPDAICRHARRDADDADLVAIVEIGVAHVVDLPLADEQVAIARDLPAPHRARREARKPERVGVGAELQPELVGRRVVQAGRRDVVDRRIRITPPAHEVGDLGKRDDEEVVERLHRRVVPVDQPAAAPTQTDRLREDPPEREDREVRPRPPARCDGARHCRHERERPEQEAGKPGGRTDETRSSAQVGRAEDV